jgi:hypothetical protein
MMSLDSLVALILSAGLSHDGVVDIPASYSGATGSDPHTEVVNTEYIVRIVLYHTWPVHRVPGLSNCVFMESELPTESLNKVTINIAQAGTGAHPALSNMYRDKAA